MRTSEIEWEQTGARVDPALVSFLHAHVRETRSNSNGGFVTKGFGALRRVHLVTILRKHGVPLEREDMPLSELVMRANMAWSEGRLGDREKWLNGKPDEELMQARAQLDAQREKIDRLESMMAKFLESQLPKMEKEMKRGPSTWNLLQKQAKELGIDIAGKNKEQLEALIAEKEG